MQQTVTPLDISRKQARKLLDQYRVTDGRKFHLKNYEPADTAGYSLDKPEATALLQEGVRRLAELQEKLYAQPVAIGRFCRCHAGSPVEEQP